MFHLWNQLNIRDIKASSKMVPIDCSHVFAWSFDELFDDIKLTKYGSKNSLAFTLSGMKNFLRDIKCWDRSRTVISSSLVLFGINSNLPNYSQHHSKEMCICLSSSFELTNWGHGCLNQGYHRNHLKFSQPRYLFCLFHFRLIDGWFNSWICWASLDKFLSFQLSLSTQKLLKTLLECCFWTQEFFLK